MRGESDENSQTGISPSREEKRRINDGETVGGCEGGRNEGKLASAGRFWQADGE
jgi:hypothetical protein